MAAEDRALRAARQDIPRALQRNELAAAADALLALPGALRAEFNGLPEALRAKVTALHGQRAWVPLHAFAARAEKHPPLVADDATWWSLLIASAQQRDLARAARLWQRLRPSVPSATLAAAVDAWLSGDDAPASLCAMLAPLPAEDPRLGQQPVSPRASVEAPKATPDIRAAVLRAFATQPFSAVASMLPGWAARFNAAGSAALWELAVPLTLCEMLRRIKGLAAGSPEEPLRLALQGIESANGPAMAPHRALLARYATAALRGQLPGVSCGAGISALRVPLGDPELKPMVLAALDGVELSGLADGEAPDRCAELLRLAPRGAVLCAALLRLVGKPVADDIGKAAATILRADREGVQRWLAGASGRSRSAVLGFVVGLRPTDLWEPIADALWQRVDEHERLRLVSMVSRALKSAGRKLTFVFGPEHEAIARATGVSAQGARMLIQELYNELEESLVDDLDCDEIDDLIEEFAPFPMAPKTRNAWRAVAAKAHSDYHAAQKAVSNAASDAALRRWVGRGAMYDPELLGDALRGATKDAATALAREFAKRRKGLAPWIEAALCCDDAGKKAAADAVIAEGLGLFGRDIGALTSVFDAPMFFRATLRHRRRVAEAVVAAASAQPGRAWSPREAMLIRWARSMVARAQAGTAKRKAAAAKKRAKKAAKP